MRDDGDAGMRLGGWEGGGEGGGEEVGGVEGVGAEGLLPGGWWLAVEVGLWGGRRGGTYTEAGDEDCEVFVCGWGWGGGCGAVGAHCCFFGWVCWLRGLGLGSGVWRREDGG